MIDPDLIESLTEAEQAAVRSAIATIAHSGILLQQVRRMFERTASGALDESVEDLAPKILEFRWRSAGLRTLQAYGESILEEMKS